MNKFIFGLMLAAAMFGVVPNVQAVTLAELQAQLNALIAELQTLQNQQSNGGYTTGGSTGGTTTGGVSAGSFCYTFNQNLKINDGLNSYTEPMVRALQTALEKEGFPVFENEKKGGSVFGESTASAVVGFQEKYRSEILTPNGLTRGNGFVGVSTRAKLNALYGCGQTPINQVPINQTPTSQGEPPIVNISASPASITKGQSARLSVSSQNADSCYGNANGLTYVTPSETTTYSYICTNSAGTTNGSVTVYVSNAIVPVITSIDSTGQITPGAGVIVKGRNLDFTSGVYIELDGSQSITPKYLSSDSLTFYLPTDVSTGSHKIRISAKASDVSSNWFSFYVDSSGLSSPTVTLTASPSTITAGQSAVLAYTVTGGPTTTCMLNGQQYGLGSSGHGSIAVTPSQTTTYTISCTDANGTSSKNATVVVSPVTINSFVGSVSVMGSTPTGWLSWSASDYTDASIDFSCVLGTMRFYIKEDGRTVGCDKGGLVHYSSQNGNSISFNPIGNSDYMTIKFTLTLLKNGYPTGQTKSIDLTFPPTSTGGTTSGGTVNGGNVYTALQGLLQQLSKVIGN